MTSFGDLDGLIGAVPFDVVTALRTADTVAGRTALDEDTVPTVLAALADRARAASITASCAVDGTAVPAADAAVILDGDDHHLHSRAEQVLAGYRSAYDHLAGERRGTVDTSLVSEVHRLLQRFTPTPGGSLRQVEHAVADSTSRDSRSTPVKRFTPVPVVEIPARLDGLVTAYRDAQVAGRHHPVLVAGLFVLDLLAVHPYAEGNGRLARVLTNALLQDVGYDVTRYVALEAIFARSVGAYSAALLDSTHDWHDGRHDPWPWLRHLVRALAECSEHLATLTAAARRTGSKQDRVRDHVLHHAPRTFRIDDVRDALPGVSDPTIRLVLAQLRAEGLVRADAVGRGATWTRRR